MGGGSFSVRWGRHIGRNNGVKRVNDIEKGVWGLVMRRCWREEGAGEGTGAGVSVCLLRIIPSTMHALWERENRLVWLC